MFSVGMSEHGKIDIQLGRLIVLNFILHHFNQQTIQGLII